MQNKSHSNDGARNIPRSTLTGPFLSQRSGDGTFRTATNTQATRAQRPQKPGFEETDPSDDSYDISEVVTVPPVCAESFPSENSLPPLASETFKQELYIRGYLKRPVNRPSNVIPRKSRLALMFANRNVFPKLLGHWQGRKVTECLKAEQDAAETSDLDTPEKHLSTAAGCATLRTPHADALDSPWGDTNTTPSELFDLHEFSYITAYTTPPSSPSMIVDVETSRTGADLGDRKHVV